MTLRKLKRFAVLASWGAAQISAGMGRFPEAAFLMANAIFCAVLYGDDL